MKNKILYTVLLIFTIFALVSCENEPIFYHIEKEVPLLDSVVTVNVYSMIEQGEYLFAEQSYRLGMAAFPPYRENYLSLAVLLMENNRVIEARDIMEEMFKKTIRFYSWLERDLS